MKERLKFYLFVQSMHSLCLQNSQNLFVLHMKKIGIIPFIPPSQRLGEWEFNKHST